MYYACTDGDDVDSGDEFDDDDDDEFTRLASLSPIQESLIFITICRLSLH